MGSRFDAKAAPVCCSVHQSQDQEARAREMARQGCELKDIGHVLNMPLHDVHRAVGVPPRPPHRGSSL